jgi:twitching motility two-component system response regulator PilH
MLSLMGAEVDAVTEGTKARVLVVDDSDEVRELYTAVLEGAGYAVDTAASAEVAFEKIKAARPDLLLLDIVLPGMDGLELLLKLHSDLAPPIPPVILCSGFNLAEKEALRRGAVRLLRKPIASADLLDAMATVLDGHELPMEKVALARRHADAARRSNRDTASEILRRVDAAATRMSITVRGTLEDQLQTVAGYLALGDAAVALLKEDGLMLLAESKGSHLGVGSDLGRSLPEAYEVLETGSSLVLPDASAHPFESVGQALGGIRFFVGVPLMVSERIPVGVICFFKPEPLQLEAEDLSIIQLFGRRGSTLLSQLADGRPTHELAGRYGSGILPRTVFERLLDIELHLLSRLGGTMALAVMDVTAVSEVRSAILSAPHHERLMGGMLSDNRVAIFKRSAGTSAGRELSQLVDGLRRAHDDLSLGMVELTGVGLEAFHGALLLSAAEHALERAWSVSSHMERVAISGVTS